jgi:serine/threonine-protein kinase
MSQVQGGERTWIDEAADRFERHWKEDKERPRIEDFIDGLSGTRRDRLLEELLRIESELREGAGEKPGAEEYLRRFPDDGAAINAAFETPDQPGQQPARRPISAAQSLLFGLLALQNNFIDRDTLLAAFNAWVADKSKSLGQILLDRGALSPARHAVLMELVREHMDRHGDDSERSLAVLSVAPAVRDQLEQLPDLDLHAGLLALGLDDTGGGGQAEGTTETWDEESEATESEGRFRIIRFHERGALGEVFVARDQQLHRVVALKRIKLNQSADQEKRARFVVEAEITGRLEHPGIVPVYGLGTFEDGRPFYAMRFIRGDNLRLAIEQFHKDEEKGRDAGARMLALHKLLRRFLDVCNAIDYAHSRGVLHRDLKPGNIMLGKFGETLVVDWGLAKTVGRPEPRPATETMDDHTLVPESGSDLRGTEFGARLGTPAYMSPEQAAGRVDALGPASDVYSLGATLYCVLTGQAPFTDADMAELLRKVERGDFPPPRKLKGWIDPALEAICLRAMATDPARRYGTPRALANDVEPWLADEPVSAWREPIRRRMQRWGRRHCLMVTGLGAAVLVAAAGLAVGNVLVSRQRDRAEQNLAFARTVVDEMYTGVAEKLDDQSQMDDYQREILEKALVFYERFALPQSRDPQVRLGAARAGLRVGWIRQRLGNTAAAEQAEGQALSLLTGLVSGHPADPTYREALARAHQQRAAVFRNEERWSESEREIRLAADLWDGLARERPGVAAYLSEFSDAQRRLGDQYQIQGRVQDAEVRLRLALEVADRLARENPVVDAFHETLARTLHSFSSLQANRLHDFPGAITSEQKALEIMERLARAHPGTLKYQMALGHFLQGAGYHYTEVGDLQRAEAEVKRSIAILEKLAADHPQDMEIAYSQGKAYQRLALVYYLRGDRRASLDHYGRLIDWLRPLARRDPRNTRTGRAQLGAALAERAEIFTRLGRLAEALRDFSESLEIAHQNASQEEGLFRVFRALTKARMGDLSELGLLGDQARKALEGGAGPSHPIYDYFMLYYDAACVHCALAIDIISGVKNEKPEIRELAKRDLDRAFELLDSSRSSGELKSAIPPEEIRGEKLLAPLRSDPRFQLLMMDLAFPENPFGSR